jgi:hypothetical protein
MALLLARLRSRHTATSSDTIEIDAPIATKEAKTTTITIAA